MRRPDTTSRARACIPFLLLAAFLLRAPLAAGQESPRSPESQLTPETRSRLAEAAHDSRLAPWQRDFMLAAARGRVEGGATEPSPPLTDVALSPAGIAAADGAWTAFPPPFARNWHTAIYDPVRDRMVVFGGNDGSGLRNDVWVLSLGASPAWSAIVPEGTPPSPRYSHTAIYDPERDRMVVFGGNDGGYRNDVWALSLEGSLAWSGLTPGGSRPPARQQHTAIYDSKRDRMVVFGGYDGSYRRDVWALSLAGSPSWSALAPAGTPPSARYSPAAIYDPKRDRMLVFGGYDGSLHNDVWALSLAGSPTWSALASAGTPPSARYSPAAIYDPVRDRMVLFGGNDGGYRNDVWTLSLAGSPAWSALAATSPPPGRYQHSAFYDPVRDRMVVFGGFGGTNRNDAWALSLAESPAWSALAIAGISPSARNFHTAIYDPVRDRMVVFGGLDPVRNDVWALALAGSPAWNVLAPTGTPPSARIWHTAIYDPVRDRMVVFAGYDGLGDRNDVWALSLAGTPAWSELSPTGSPPSARYSPTAIYDPVRDRMVVFGGNDGISLRNDVWALSLAGSPAWSELAPVGSPPAARYQHTAFFDSVRDRMMVFGGYDGTYRNDVWALSLAESPAWSALTPAGSPPSGRYQHAAIYEPKRDRMVVFGGNDDRSLRNDVWALSLAGSPAWSALAPAGSRPTVRSDHTAIYDPERDRMVVFAGYGGGYRNDVWALRWDALVSVPPVTPRFAFAPPRPNPSRGETTVDFELAEPARVVLDVFDAAGRRVNRIADEWFTAGPHVSPWRGDDEDGRALESGVYFIRIRVGGFHSTRRAVRVR